MTSVFEALKIYSDSIDYQNYPLKCKETLEILIKFWKSVDSNTSIESLYFIKRFNSIISGYEFNEKINEKWLNYLKKNSIYRCEVTLKKYKNN